jgi:hypothetical protein
MRHSQTKVTSVLEANRLASSRVACHASQQINTPVSGGHTNIIQWVPVTSQHAPRCTSSRITRRTPPKITKACCLHLSRSHTNRFHTITSCSLRSILNIILPPTSRSYKWSLHIMFSWQQLYIPLHIVHACCASIPPHFTSSDQPNNVSCRSQWPRSLRPGSAAARLLGLRVRIPPGARMSVSFECYVLSGSGLSVGLIPRPEDSYRVWCICHSDVW